MASLTTDTVAEGYKESSLPVQNESGKTFIQVDVNPQPGDTILDLGCGTGGLSAYLAELVGPEGKVGVLILTRNDFNLLGSVTVA